MALLRKNQPAIIVVTADEHQRAKISLVKSFADGLVTTDKRREAMQATWRNLRDARSAHPQLRFHSDLDPNA